MYVGIKNMFGGTLPAGGYTVSSVIFKQIQMARAIFLRTSHSPLSSNSIFVEMPRQLPALGGATKSPRRRYTPRQKMAALALVARYMEEDGVNRTEAARQANIARSNVEGWAKLTTIFNELDRRALVKKSSHHGPKSQLKCIEDELLMYVFEMRETGMQVDYLLVLFRAARLLQSFCTKPFNAQWLAVKHFMKCHSYMYRMGTHESQRPPEEVVDKARVWLEHTRPLVTGPHRNLRYVINMDQTPVFFSMNAKKTLE